jgi:hypothetical protein
MPLDLYDIHPDKENAPHRDVAYDRVPELVWERYWDQPKELKKRERALARSPEYAFHYALDVLGGPFPAGEPAIAREAQYAYKYARYVLKEPWPAGEPAIAGDPYYAYRYANHVLGLPAAAAVAWPEKLKEGLLAELLGLRRA